MKYTLALLLLVSSFSVQSQILEQGLLETIGEIEGRENLARVQAAEQILERMGISPVRQDFEFENRSSPANGTNLISRFGPSNADEGILVIGAHIDAVVFRDGSYSDGAIDNAAGSAILLHLIDRLKSHEFKHPVEFVLFDSEELGLVGSRHYAEQENDQIFAMVNIDIGLSGSTVFFGPSSFPKSEALIDLSLSLCAEQTTNCVAFPQMPPGDDRSFRAKDIPNISFAVLPEKQVHQLWLLMNAGDDSGLAENFAPEILSLIHTPNDKIELIDEESVTLLLNHLESYIVSLDQMTSPIK